jgi:hypothetical protein
MSYDTNWASGSSDSDIKRLKAEADKLARIACEALTELEKVGKADFLILKNDELREWWEAHKEADRKEQARIAEAERRERVRKEALSRLTDEEKELLGLKKPTVKKHKKIDSPTGWGDPEEIEYMVDDFRSAYNAIMKRK